MIGLSYPNESSQQGEMETLHRCRAVLAVNSVDRVNEDAEAMAKDRR
jgi:hypothetical protein